MASTSSLLFLLGLLIALGQGMATRVEAAAPEWSQKLAGAKRFKLVLDDAAVLDKETNLVWEKSPDTNDREWFNAQVFCNDKSVGNRKGWRLPTVQELASLVDPTQGNPTLPAGHPFTNVQSSSYWSATAGANDAAFAWHVDFFSGVVSRDDKSHADFVWCVRGGHGGPDVQ